MVARQVLRLAEHNTKEFEKLSTALLETVVEKFPSGLSTPTQPSGGKHPVDARIQRLIMLIEDDPHQKLSLVSMGLIAGLSSSRLRHKFKSEVGTTPTIYLRTVRMKKAAELLRSNQLTVKEVRAAIGLESDSYFTHQCKRTFGIAPSRLKAR